MSEHVDRGTIEDRADEASSKRGLLLNVIVYHDWWSVGLIGPRLVPGVRHGLDGYGEGGTGERVEN